MQRLIEKNLRTASISLIPWLRNDLVSSGKVFESGYSTIRGGQAQPAPKEGVQNVARRKLRKGESSFDAPRYSERRRSPKSKNETTRMHRSRDGSEGRGLKQRNPNELPSKHPVLDASREKVLLQNDEESLGVPGVARSFGRGKKTWNSKSDGKVYKKGVRNTFAAKEHSMQSKPSLMPKKKVSTNPAKIVPKIIQIPADVTVLQFSKLIGVALPDVERVLADIGEVPQSHEETLCMESAELVAMELGKVIEIIKETVSNNMVNAAAVQRPSVVTVMGHVDHGKTSLLDALRSTRVVEREAGGITQHVGAFEVTMPESGNSLTFLDTPGHAAFSAMRARGAAITDIVVLVVAADDGVMPQTKEAYAHAKAAGCPIVVAITKCDLEGANIDKVKQEISELGLEIEDYGGNVQVVEMAAPKGIGLKELETALLLESEILEPKSPLDVPAKGVVVESRMDKGQGPVAMVIVTHGKLHSGEYVVVGSQWGRVRALKDPGGKELGDEGVSPGKPVEVIGLKGLPNAGDELTVVATDDRAQKLSKARTLRGEQVKASHTMSDSISTENETDISEAASGFKSIPIIIKADVHGSAEALKESLVSLGNESVKINVVHVGVGPVTSSDIDLAVPFGSEIVGFNVKIAADAESKAKKQGIRIMSRRIIYEILEDLEAIIEGATPKPLQDVIVGSAEVLALFKVPGRKGQDSKHVAGCRVTDGSIKSGLKVEVVRSGEVVHVGEINTLRRHKLDVEVVGKGTECGVSVVGFENFMVGDMLSCVELQ